MKSSSFQLKITLLSTLLSGLVVIAFGAYFLRIIYEEGLQQIDQQIKALGESQLLRPPSGDLGEEFEKSLRFVYGQDGQDHFMIRVLNLEGSPLYTSPQWPDELSDTDLPLPEFREMTEDDSPYGRPPPPRHEGRRPPPHERPDRGPPDRGRPERGVHDLIEPQLVTIQQAQQSWRVGVMGHERITVIIAMNLSTFEAEIRRYEQAFLISAPIALLLLALAGWILARRALSPVRTITDTARGITAKGLDQRIPPLQADGEFEELIQVINQMLERLERSFTQAARFSSDASHELKTPLTILQGQLEQALHDAQEGSAQQQTYSGLLEEVQRLKIITRKLLLLSQADAGKMPLGLEQVDLSARARALIEDLHVIAPDIKLTHNVQEGVSVNADPDLLEQLLQNLASNAVKFCKEPGEIEVTLEKTDGKAVFSIANTADPMSEEDATHVFDRFYRTQQKGKEQIDGFGLGLSLSHEIAREHQGDLTIQQKRAGWVTFQMILLATS